VVVAGVTVAPKYATSWAPLIVFGVTASTKKLEKFELEVFVTS
jgi:hypothetical protein